MRVKLFVLLIPLLVLLSGIVAVRQNRLTSQSTPPIPSPTPIGLSPEIIEIIKNTDKIEMQVANYKTLIERIGPEEAQEALQQSGLPFDGQTHLLNHTVGDWLYEKEGAAGLRKCKDYFLSSCYHGFVIDAVAVGGVPALVGVMEECWTKGEHVAIQCSHAIGHGFLAWVGYASLMTSLSMCDELTTKSKNFPVYNCYDGAFMENVWAVHGDGKPASDRWVKEDDPYYPCNDTRILPKYIKGCWSNQPSLLYQRFHGDLSNVASVCQTIQDEKHQETCFDGLARQIHPLTKGSVDETFRMCGLLPKPWDDACVASNAKASFSVGDRTLPFQICSRMIGDGRDRCYRDLVGIIGAYFQEGAERDALCAKMQDAIWKSRCMGA